VPVKVTEWNLEECKKMIMRSEYPLTNYVIRPDGKRKKVTEKSREELSTTLELGCIIERQLQDGDTVIFNRQPSLHRISMMCHTVKVLPGRSFRLNLAVCPPYNADFDGDEMNLHVPQTEEARVEADVLMKVQDQIISPRNGRAIIKGQEDHVSGAYFLTRKPAEFDKAEACRILSVAGIYELPKPDRGERYSGRLLFSQLLPKDFNLAYVSKLCREKTCKKEECADDGYVVIKNGKLISGAIESKGFESELIEKMVRDYGSDAAREFIDNATRMALYVISKHGFSVDLTNYTLSEDGMKQVDEITENAKREVDSLVVQYKNKTLPRLPGRTLRETLEERIMMALSDARDNCEDIVQKCLGAENTSILMARIGSRGSILNAIQMSAMLGQQAVRGKRISRGYRGRPLIHFRRGDLGADSKGFVASSFRKGLNPKEYFFHAMGGRESLVNTAIRTARSGYMQRRLINALQDLVVHPDGTVRDSGGIVVQFTYGGDGNDPKKITKGGEIMTGPERE